MKSLYKKGFGHFRTPLHHLLLIFFSLLLSASVYSQTPSWQWVREATGPASSSDVEGWHVAADGSGNVYATGLYYGDSLYFGGAALANHSSYGMYVVKYDENGNVLWATQPDGGFGPDPRGIATDPAGNVMVTGIFSDDSISFGAVTLVNTSGMHDMFVVKYDPNGNVLWASNAGGIGRDWGEGVASDGAGNIFVAGSFESHSMQIGSFTLTNTTQVGVRQDAFLAKYDAAGNVLWAVNAGGGNNDWSTAVAADPFGNSYTCGPLYSAAIHFGADSLVNPHGNGHIQNFIASYDSSGNFRWARQITLTAQAFDNYLYDMATDAFGNLFVVGDCISDTVFIDTLLLIHDSPSRDMIIAKYDSGGSLLWAKRPQGNNTIYPFAISVDASGDAYAAGYFDCDTLAFDSSTYLLVNPAYNSDLFVAKYRPDGEILWAKGTGGLHLPGSWGYAQVGITAGPLGKVYAGGCYYSDSLVFDNDTAYLNNCTPNTFVAKLGDAGNCTASFLLVADSTYPHLYWIVDQAAGASPLSYVWQWGDSTVDSIPYPSHTYAVGGFYPICLTITDTTGCSDTYCHTFNLLRMTQAAASNVMVQVNVVPVFPTGIHSPGEKPGILLYPNPARAELNLVSPAGGMMQVEFYSLLGQSVYKQETGGVREITLSVSSLPSGIYFVKVTGENGEWVGRMAKE